MKKLIFPSLVSLVLAFVAGFSVALADATLAERRDLYRLEQDISRDLEARLKAAHGQLFHWLVVSATVEKPVRVASEQTDLPGLLPSATQILSESFASNEMISWLTSVRIEMGVPKDLAKNSRMALQQVAQQHFAALGKKVAVRVKFVDVEPQSVATDPVSKEVTKALASGLEGLKVLTESMTGRGSGGSANPINNIVMPSEADRIMATERVWTPIVQKAIAAIVVTLIIGALGIMWMMWGTTRKLSTIGQNIASAPSALSNPSPAPPQQERLGSLPAIPSAQSSTPSEGLSEKLGREIAKDEKLAADVAAFLATGGRFDLLQVLLGEASADLRQTIVTKRLTPAQMQSLRTSVRERAQTARNDEDALRQELIELLMMGMIDTRGLQETQLRARLKNASDQELVKMLSNATPRQCVVVAGLIGSARVAWLVGSGLWAPKAWPEGVDTVEASDAEMTAIAQKLAQLSQATGAGWRDFSADVARHLPAKSLSHLPSDLVAAIAKQKKSLVDRMDLVSQIVMGWPIADVADLLAGWENEQRKILIAKMPELRRRQLQARNFQYSPRSGLLQVQLMRELDEESAANGVGSPHAA